MSQDADFYLARADEDAAVAASATLDNVRDRALRSEAAWRDMADRLQRVAERRKIADDVREARRSEEARASDDAEPLVALSPMVAVSA